MSVKEENKAIIRRLAEIGNTSEYANFATNNSVLHTADGMDIDIVSSQQRASILQNALPDFQSEIEDMVAEGDKVAVRYKWHGTHKDKFVNINPSGNEISVKCYMIYRFEDGKIAEVWMLQDYYHMFLQMGAVPPIWELGK